jgi:hypothetical protein
VIGDVKMGERGTIRGDQRGAGPSTGVYRDASVVVQKFADDALHVAHATIARADVIVSWNFKHLVNPAKIRSFNGINMANGYGMIVILSPEDVIMIMETENEKD